jgi:dimethylsulfone monooxygenase
VVHERSGRWVQSAAGGDDHYSGDLMETFTWAGAVAAVTERIGIISTVHVTVNHPVFVAKGEATVDLISTARPA